MLNKFGKEGMKEILTVRLFPLPLVCSRKVIGRAVEK